MGLKCLNMKTRSLVWVLAAACSVGANMARLKDGLIFYAGFNGNVKAQIAGGDTSLYWAPRMKLPAEGKVGLPPEGVVTLARGEGKFGDCLKFEKKAPQMVFYRAKGNFPYSREAMEGTVSFWLRLTPDEDLAPGYTDPIQITSKKWDDAAFFVEFSKDEKPREFRLGVYADKSVWNPENKDWNSIAMSEKPLARVERPPFQRDEWTHVLFTFQNFNTRKPDGLATLYLNGKPRAELAPREQTFTWEVENALIMLGLSYAGFFDELAIYDRVLEQGEIEALYQLEKPLGEVAE